MMEPGGTNWSILTILGPLLILLVLAWALMRNKKKNRPEDIARTEAATRELYREEEAAHRGEDDRVP